jgi:hypothetical protein
VARQQKVETVVTDDLTGETLTDSEVETVSFAVDGITYEIDLSPTNASSLRNDIAMWIEHARPTTRVRKASSTSKTGKGGKGGSSTKGSGAGKGSETGAKGRVTADRERSVAIREWANAHGHTVSDRGRIPAAVVAAYDATH